MKALKLSLTLVGLWIAYLVLFLGGVSVLGPALPADALTPAQQAASLPMAAAIAAIDLSLVALWVSRSRLAGWRLWLVVAAVLYGVKTFSSQLEAWWFVTEAHLPRAMIPHLFVMTLPLCVLWPGLVVLALGPRATEPPTPLGRTPADVTARVLLSGAVLYPLLFFLFGYFVAWQSPVLRAYYDGPATPLPPLQHFAALFASQPLLLPFEAARGLLWVAMGWAILRTTRGPWWVGALLFAEILALVQNDVHLLPNPLMPDDVRFWHFIETAPSNFLFALGTGYLLRPRAA